MYLETKVHTEFLMQVLIQLKKGGDRMREVTVVGSTEMPFFSYKCSSIPWYRESRHL
jgi:hypothetical protein